MNKLKKFFKFLPVVAIAFVSGLAGLLRNDQTKSIAYADTLALVTTFNESISYNFNTTDYIGISYRSNTVYNSRTFDVNIYKELSNGTYIVSISYLNLASSSSLVQLITSPFSTVSFNLAQDYGSTFSFNNLVDNGYSSDTRSMSLTLVEVDVGASSELFGNYRYLVREHFSITIDGFGTFDTWATGGTNSNYMVFDYLNAGNALTSTSIVPSSSISMFSHNVNIAQNNYQDGFQDGYSVGYQDGYNNGYSDGSSDGYSSGYNNGYTDGSASREQDITTAYNDGYNAGYADGYSVDSTVASIFSGILQVGMLPINVLLAIFNFEILGINLSAFISAILTVCLTIIVIRTIKGGGSSD